MREIGVIRARAFNIGKALMDHIKYVMCLDIYRHISEETQAYYILSYVVPTTAV